MEQVADRPPWPAVVVAMPPQLVGEERACGGRERDPPVALLTQQRDGSVDGLAPFEPHGVHVRAHEPRTIHDDRVGLAPDDGQHLDRHRLEGVLHHTGVEPRQVLQYLPCVVGVGVGHLEGLVVELGQASLQGVENHTAAPDAGEAPEDQHAAALASCADRLGFIECVGRMPHDERAAPGFGGDQAARLQLRQLALHADLRKPELAHQPADGRQAIAHRRPPDLPEKVSSQVARSIHGRTIQYTGYKASRHMRRRAYL